MSQNIFYGYARIIMVVSFYLCNSMSAFAAQKLGVTCWQNNCLKFGWSIRGAKITDAIENKCRDEDCTTKGWYGAEFAGRQYYTQCISDACFKNGYRILQSYTHKILATIRCLGPEQAPDCFKYGWDVSGPDGGYRVRCEQNDCAYKGWRYNQPQVGYNQIICDSGGCFTHGWTQKIFTVN